MLAQAKIDLAVLLKLFQHAEGNGGAETPQSICDLFNGQFPLRRIELALETLAARGEVTREYDRYHENEGLWQISREGLRTMEKALSLPQSFIARANSGGDGWLGSEEAQSAKLNRNSRYAAPVAPSTATPSPDSTPIVQPPVSIVVSPTFNNSVGAADAGEVARSSKLAGWISAWGTWASVVIASVAIATTYYFEKSSH